MNENLQRALTWTGYIFVVVIVFLSLFAIMNKMADSTDFKQKVYARDNALIESILLADDYNHTVRNAIDDDFEFIFEECSIFVNERGTPVKSGREYFCADSFSVSKDYSKVSGDYAYLVYNVVDGELVIMGESDE